MTNLNSLLDKLHNEAHKVVNDKYKGRLTLLITACDVHNEYEKIRPEDEEEMTSQEIADYMVEKLKGY